ncbi:1-aminocyclopropane-1-carboxylate deaminase [Arcobacter sp. LA11]|uniref:1-aminocyclopropane-1-carboxylate deaminase n=1 Tax=Arcobacter sp. LA11 TaxID=1898176 RepID=UPI000935336B|nr:1-aminocyclopropane-1-carboxylate deaminase [Arcobacter sp. LA11]
MKDINKYINSPITDIKFRDKKIYVKRDDLLDEDFSGNKARKFYYFLVNDFPNIKKIISYGSAQANSLYSLSVLSKLKGLELDFYVNHISSFLKQNPQGNYKESLKNGANIIEKDEENIQQYIEKNLLNEETLFIEEGGRIKEAEFGIKILADEIKTWALENKIKDLKIILPSGTGTTALFLQKNLSFEVLTVACVGGSEYLKKQFFHLEKDEKMHPTILETSKKYHFGKLYKEFYQIWEEVKNETKIEFDLLYDPLAFISLENSTYLQNKEILYIHQGGILGNETMIERYKRKYKF